MQMLKVDTEMSPSFYFRFYLIKNIDRKLVYNIKCLYNNKLKKFNFNGKHLAKFGTSKNFEHSFDILNNNTIVNFELSSKRSSWKWMFDFKEMCRDFSYRKKFSLSKGIEVYVCFKIHEFGHRPEDAYPFYSIFNKEYQFEPIMIEIFSYLTTQKLISDISILSKYIRSAVMTKMEFPGIVSLGECDLNDIIRLGKTYKNCGKFYISNLYPHKSIRNRKKQDFLNISQIQIHNMRFPTNRSKVILLQKLVLNLPNIEFLCFRVPLDIKRDKQTREEEEEEYSVIKYEEIEFPFQTGNKKVQSLLEEKRKKIIGKKTSNQLFYARPNESTILVVHGFVFSIEFSNSKKSVILYNDTDGVVADIFCRLLIEDRDRNRNSFRIPVLYTRDFLSPEEFRPFESEDLIKFWNVGGGDAKIQFRIFQVIKSEEYQVILGQGNPTSFDQVRVEVGKKLSTTIKISPDEFNEDFEEKSLVTKDLKLLGIRWTLEVIGFKKDTYIHLYISPNLYGETVLHYVGNITFCIDNKWYMSHRNSSVCSSGGLECGIDISKEVELDVNVCIDRIWENRITDEEHTRAGKSLETIMNHPVGMKESIEIEINSFYRFSQFYVEMLDLGWIFTFMKKGDTVSVSVERGFDLDIITPIHFHIELLQPEIFLRDENDKVEWKIESILCFYTFKGQFYRYGKLPLDTFDKIVGDREYFKIKLTLMIGEKFTTKELYSQGLRKIVDVSKKLVNEEFSEIFEVIIPEENLKSKLPFIACFFIFAGIKYTCEFSPCRNGYVSLTLSHRLPFHSTLLKKEFVLKLLDDDDDDVKKEEEEEGEGEGIYNQQKLITVKTEDSFIDFDQICPTDMSKKKWRFKITMHIKEVSKENFTLMKRIQKTD